MASTVALAESTVDAFNNAIKDGVNTEFETFNPTVRPVLDTTDLHKGLESLKTVDIPATVSGIGRVKEERREPGENRTSDMRPSVTFNQNNYSPEALSEAAIYRNTRNLVSRLEYT